MVEPVCHTKKGYPEEPVMETGRVLVLSGVVSTEARRPPTLKKAPMLRAPKPSDTAQADEWLPAPASARLILCSSVTRQLLRAEVQIHTELEQAPRNPAGRETDTNALQQLSAEDVTEGSVQTSLDRPRQDPAGPRQDPAGPRRTPPDPAGPRRTPPAPEAPSRAGPAMAAQASLAPPLLLLALLLLPAQTRSEPEASAPTAASTPGNNSSAVRAALGPAAQAQAQARSPRPLARPLLLLAALLLLAGLALPRSLG
ncbi:uncharacterized protein [Dipodomys merriami]|uniref:uncharacterized protein n=1 Tax=Dipodomys merriami TaxID=94247 RepID=UPI003855AFFE